MNYPSLVRTFFTISLVLGTKSCSEIFYGLNSSYKVTLSLDGGYVNINHRDSEGNFINNLNLSVNSIGLDGGVLNITLVEKGKPTEIDRVVLGVSDRLKLIREYYQGLEFREDSNMLALNPHASPNKEGR